MSRYQIENLIEETLADLSGHTMDQGQLTWLTAGVDDSDLELTVHDSSQVRRGAVEVGEELMYAVTSADSKVKLAPFGRGYLGTTASSHDENALVSYSPRYPRSRIRKAINDTIESVWPLLFSVATTDIQVGGPQITYELPSDVEDIFTVKQAVRGPSQFEQTFTRYGLNRDGDTPTLDLFEGFWPGAPLRVTYMTKPRRLEAGEGFTDSGLEEPAWPAIQYGAMFRLINPTASGAVGLHSARAAENQRQHEKRPTDLARQYFAAHQQFVADERARLLAKYEIVNSERTL